MNIEISSLIFFSVISIIPLGIFIYLGINQKSELFISFLRMVIQLVLVGIYLKYIFQVDSLFLNLLWVFVMILTASVSVKNRSKIKIKYFSLGIFLSFLGTLLFIACSLLIIFPFETLKSARYLIPIIGMILGNSLRGNIVGISNFNESLQEKESEYIHYIFLGATYSEALKPFLKNAFKVAISPQLAGLATIGLVSLPGMMTGQILGGSDPITAVKYQIMIMIAIFTSVSLSTFLVLFVLSKLSVDNLGRIKK